MYQKAITIYYGLAIFVLMAALFVLQPTKYPEVAALQGQIKQEFSVAWQQTIGDQPYFEDLSFVYDSVTQFYSQSADAAIAVISPQGSSDEDVIYVFQTIYNDFAAAMGKTPTSTAIAQIPTPIHIPRLPEGEFMTEAPVNNLVPMQFATKTSTAGAVAGVSTQAEPANKNNSWITVQDNYTGQLYCLAIYNGEVNKYLGACKSNYQ